MKWTECARLVEEFNVRSRFDWPAEGVNGLDCNEATTINDLLGLVGWVWTWPGDFILSSPGAQSFFELTNETVIGSGWSVALPLFLLFTLFAVLDLNKR